MAKPMFTLEVVDAAHGDALLVHYGTPAAPKHILLDGGPKKTYATRLGPRLREIAAAVSPGAPLRLERVALTHIDEDHIQGLLDLLNDPDSPVRTPHFWFNAFDDLRSELPPELADTNVIDRRAGSDMQSVAVISSVGQGVDLRDKVRARAARVNLGDGHLLVADGAALGILDQDGIRVSLVAPDRGRLRKLFADWQKKTRDVGANTARAEAITSDYVDRSVYNLSSLVMVVETTSPGPPKRMLLTGDARGDDILAGLESGGFLAEGKAHFDIFKMPHHGSSRNMELAFLKAITADHYVISANGRDGNPDDATVEWIAEARGDSAYTIHLTNDRNPLIPEFRPRIAKLRTRTALGAKLVVRPPADSSMKVELATPIPF